MDSYSIGISGLNAAQKAIGVIGNNIANAATEGYHRQRINLTPAYASQLGSILLGGGVDVSGVTRMIDSLLEQEILRQQSSLAQLSRELGSLRTVESAFGELSVGSSLSTAIDEFFNALQDLTAHPSEIIWQNQALTAAEAMASRFRTLGEFLTSLETQIRLEAENTVEQINALTNQIAKLNDSIQRIEIGGGQANNLRDQRDQCISELSELIGVETQAREYGVVDVSIGGIAVVSGSSVTELEVGLNENNCLAITVAGASNYNTDAQGGRLGGLLSLKNVLISDIHDDLDDLASAIIQQINQYHVQGVGSTGSFTELAGWTMASENLADFSNVSDGYLYIRVTDTSTSTITRTAVPVLQGASSDTLTEIADYITNNVTGVTASVNSSNQLTISVTDTKYQFDFLPAVLPEPEPAPKTLTGTPPPDIAVSGIYTGTINSTFTCTVSGVSGQIGVTDGLKLEISKDGTLIKELNVGLGYAAGDKLDLGDGLYISLSITSGETAGDLNVGDNFQIKGWADTDTSGLLAAVGINTFFSGTNATDMAVCSDIAATPGRIAAALSAEMTDNANALRMVALRDQAVGSLDSMSPGEFYRRLVTDIGQQLYIKQMREDNIEGIIQNLANQQSDISGVDINNEAARLLLFEQMFQAMAKYLSIVQSSLLTLMEIV